MTNSIPDMIVYRYDDDTFIEYSLDDEFSIIGAGKEFHPQNDDDSYYELTESQIAIAKRVDCGSLDLYWVTIEKDGNEVIIANMGPTELNAVVQGTILDCCVKN